LDQQNRRCHGIYLRRMQQMVKQVFGEEGLEKLIQQREQETFNNYSKLLVDINDIKERLNALAQIRSDEGYMATIEEKGGVF
jgi:predicted ArsR family transcriptional regulator